MKLQTRLAVLVCKASGAVLRKLGRGGTNLPGKLALKIDKNILGELSRGVKVTVVTGTNGKTTTTSMCTHIIMAAGLDPTVMIGGTLPLLHSGYRVGHGDTIILESCEYCNSFLSFYPTVAVILNIEADHLDFFKDLEDVEHSFRAFADLVPPGGTVLANGEDENTMKALEGKEGVLTFGLETGNFHAKNLTWDLSLIHI